MVFELINSLEEKFVYQNAKEWAQKYWTISIYASIIYVVSIFSIKWYMTNRQPFDLRRWLFAWSLMLSLFSIVGFCHTGYAMLNGALTKGWHASVCKLKPTEIWEDGLPLYMPSPQLWTYAFCFSKLPELLDTYFIVLRKQKLIFLHWYHHITVMIYCFYYYGFTVTTTQWFAAMNYFVHSFMYMYYALRASGYVRIPKWVNMFITTLQLLQMIAGVWINIYILINIIKVPNFYCDGFVEKDPLHLTWAFLMYGSYFVLFAIFFYDVYLRSATAKLTKVGSESSQKHPKLAYLSYKEHQRS